MPNRPDGPDWRDAPLEDELPAWPIVARIWRTVDVERTVAAIGLATELLDADELLGGRGVLVRPADGPPIAILEPSTEGRLAAALARAAEGDAGVYVAPAGGIEEARRSGIDVGPSARGPFGRAALAGPPSSGPSGGPSPSPSPRPAIRFVVIVDRPPGTMPR